MFPNIPLVGQYPKSEVITAQFVIPAGGGATFSNANSATVSAGGVCTFTSNAAHGLTMNPAAGTMPNYFVTFGASSSAMTGTGVLVGNIFRILTIPSTTTFTFWSTISTATVTSTTVIPIFFPNMLAGVSTNIGNEPTQTISAVVTKFAAPQLTQATIYANQAANCAVRYNAIGSAIALDQTTGVTPATAPTWRDLIAASTTGMAIGAYPYLAIWANGTTATSQYSVLD